LFKVPKLKQSLVAMDPKIR